MSVFRSRQVRGGGPSSAARPGAATVDAQMQNGCPHEPREAASGPSSMARTQEYYAGCAQDSVARVEVTRATAGRGRPLAPSRAAQQHSLQQQQQQQQEAEEGRQFEDGAPHLRQPSETLDATANSQSISSGTDGFMTDAGPAPLTDAAGGNRPRPTRGRGGRLMMSPRSALSNCSQPRSAFLLHSCCVGASVWLVSYYSHSELQFAVPCVCRAPEFALLIQSKCTCSWHRRLRGCPSLLL